MKFFAFLSLVTISGFTVFMNKASTGSPATRAIPGANTTKVDADPDNNPTPLSVNCNNWLNMPSKLSGVTVGQLNVTGNQITVEAMCNAVDIYDLSRALVSKHEDPRDVNYFLCPDLAQITTSNGFYSISSPCSFVSNKTYHVAMVYNGSSLKLYRNGFLMAETAASGNLVTNGWPTTIGEYAYSMYYGLQSISNIFKGYINEVRIWNVARTQAQIRTYMNTSLPNPGSQTGLLAYYTFDDLNNKQGNAAYNGTLRGASTINNSNPNCNFVADSCDIPAGNNTCNGWLNMPDKLCGVTVGDLDVTGNQVTVEAMCDATDIYNLSRALVSKHEYPGDVNYFLCPDLAQITTTNGFFSASSPCGFVSNKTYHVAMVYNGSSLKLYRNGFLMSEVAASGNLVNNDWPTTIGEYAYSMFTGSAGISNIFKGYINEVRIWNVARTQQQIRDYMNTSLPDPATQTGLMAYYTFDDLTNKQGNAAFNGTLRGTSTINNTNPVCSFTADSCAVGGPLPVSLTIFTARAVDNKKILLNWHTEEETGIAEYTVERASAANGPFAAIGTVNAINSSAGTDYSFTDNTAKLNVPYFYRLRITERSGIKKYSAVRNAMISGKGLFVNVYPNPATDVFTVQVANSNEPVFINLYDNLGQLLLQKRASINSSSTTVNISSLPTGTYWIQVIAGKEKRVKRVEKL